MSQPRPEVYYDVVLPPGSLAFWREGAVFVGGVVLEDRGRGGIEVAFGDVVRHFPRDYFNGQNFLADRGGLATSSGLLDRTWPSYEACLADAIKCLKQ